MSVLFGLPRGSDTDRECMIRKLRTHYIASLDRTVEIPEGWEVVTGGLVQEGDQAWGDDGWLDVTTGATVSLVDTEARWVWCLIRKVQQ